MDLEKQRVKEGETSVESRAPVPHLALIESTGLIKVTFSSDMHIVPQLSMLRNGTV